ncbi:hypothetical protein M422DRAFT_254750 [Sphaerobolus stellatus SS14]|uniref:Uncharacterized protein n=1 Tax=Sphaerobolus stellatus (strain SS14) TaxID=990650 RepID=A0A0C9VU30_SPHS4|nr:hypothetical protein M422DRAFT_254750 [Sphaerobolus stellatus SS14]
MSPQIVRKFIFWKKSSTKKEIDGLGADWIGDAMKVANLTIAAGEAVPGVGGFMKAAGGIFVALLQPLQQMGKNKEDCKALITNITQLLQTINEELETLSSAGNLTIANSSNAWTKFERSLEDTREKMTKFNSEERFLSRYLRAERIRDIILGYQTEIERLQKNLLLANVLATRLQVNNIQCTLTASNEDDPEIDDYYQVKPADIYLTEALDGSSRTRSSVEEYLAKVNCGGMEKSAMVRRYNGQDKEKVAISYLTDMMPGLCSAGRLLSYIPAGEYLVLSNIDHDGGSDFTIRRPKICEYRSTDNRVVLSIKFEGLTESYPHHGFRIYPEHSINEYLLQKINHPDVIRHLPRDEMVSLLRAFHSIVPLQKKPFNNRKNVPLGSITLHLPFTDSEDYQMDKHQPRDYDSGMFGMVVAHFKEGAICDSSWQTWDGHDVHYETQCTAKRTRVWFKPQNLEDHIPNALFRFSAKVDVPERYGAGYPPFLAQINSIVPKIKKFWSWLRYDISICYMISWSVYVELPHGGKTIRNSPNLYLFLENPVIDASGYLQDPCIYWSMCPSGITSLTVLQLFSLGITDLPHTYKTIGSFDYVYHSQKDVLNSMYEACGLNAESDEISELMGYPLPEHKDFHKPILLFHKLNKV